MTVVKDKQHITDKPRKTRAHLATLPQIRGKGHVSHFEIYELGSAAHRFQVK